MNIFLKPNEVDWLIQKTSPLVSLGQNDFICAINKE